MMYFRNSYAWIIACIMHVAVSGSFDVEKYLVPLIFLLAVAFLNAKYQIRHIQYLLFFSISFASLLGFTETLTGSHAESSNLLLYGLSFYTASMAYLITQNKLNYQSVLSISNPLLLSTGPIALYFKCICYKSLRQRIEYYFPFIIVGTFMFQVIGSPLTEYFFLIDVTDIVTSLTFAAIFELFVYVNFCGLSLLIYGVFGVLGFRIPLNFKQPFSSSNIIEFWKGWHISLSQVLKILFYNPMRKRYSLLAALLVVYTASAMWHGVTLNFLLWGSFHAFFFWLTIKILKQKNSILPLILLPFIILVGRLIFADSDTARLLDKLTFSFEGFGVIDALQTVPLHSHFSLLFAILIVSCEFIFKKSKIMQKRNYKFLRTPISLLILCVLGILFASNVGVDYAVYGQR